MESAEAIMLNAPEKLDKFNKLCLCCSLEKLNNIRLAWMNFKKLLNVVSLALIGLENVRNPVGDTSPLKTLPPKNA